MVQNIFFITLQIVLIVWSNIYSSGKNVFRVLKQTGRVRVDVQPQRTWIVYVGKSDQEVHGVETT